MCKTLFALAFSKRWTQLFCKHNYFAVAVTDNYQEIGAHRHVIATIYKCKKCEHARIYPKG